MQPRAPAGPRGPSHFCSAPKRPVTLDTQLSPTLIGRYAMTRPKGKLTRELGSSPENPGPSHSSGHFISNFKNFPFLYGKY